MAALQVCHTLGEIPVFLKNNQISLKKKKKKKLIAYLLHKEMSGICICNSDT